MAQRFKILPVYTLDPESKDVLCLVYDHDRLAKDGKPNYALLISGNLLTKLKQWFTGQVQPGSTYVVTIPDFVDAGQLSKLAEQHSAIEL